MRSSNTKISQLSYANVLVMVCCTILYAAHTCLVRYFHEKYDHAMPSHLIACYQYVISIVLLSPFIIRGVIKQNHGLLNIISNFKSLHGAIVVCKNYIIRCSMIFCSAIAWFYALQKTSAINCIAISCLTPIFIMILAKVSLGEKVSYCMWCFAVIAFSGALMILQPTFSSFDTNSLPALLTALIWACNSVFTKKKLSIYHNSVTIFFTTAVMLSVIAIPIIITQSSDISQQQLFFLAMITLIFDVANILLIWVFSRGGINMIAIFDFLRVAFTSILSTILLDEQIHQHTICGITLILIANYLVTIYGTTLQKNTVAEKTT